MCYIYIWICKSSACPLSHLDETIFFLLLGFSSLKMCVCVHSLILVLLFDGFHYNTNQSLNNASDKPWKTTITKIQPPPFALPACPAPNITHLRDYTIHSLKDICRWAYDRLAAPTTLPRYYGKCLGCMRWWWRGGRHSYNVCCTWFVVCFFISFITFNCVRIINRQTSCFSLSFALAVSLFCSALLTTHCVAPYVCVCLITS